MTRSRLGQGPTATQSLAYRSSDLGSRVTRGELPKIEEEDVVDCQADASLLEGPRPRPSSRARALQLAEEEEPMCPTCLGPLQSEPGVAGECERCEICGNDFLNLCYYCLRCCLGLCVSCSLKEHEMERTEIFEASQAFKNAPLGIDGSSLHNIALIYAPKNQKRLVQMRLEKGADINARDELGQTPLH